MAQICGSCRRLCGRSLQALVLLAAASLCTGFVAPTQSPPGGLDPSQTPQFILLTHDDAVVESTHSLLRSITDGRSFSGCPATGTLFVTTQYGNDCELTMDLYNAGYEVGDHTQNHVALAGLGEKKVAKEILGARADLVACGVPESDVVGMRGPYLASDETVRKVLSENGFLYDSSLIEEGSSYSLSNGMESRVWPFQMDEGVPMNCGWFAPSQSCSTSESWPGLFEVPAWQLTLGSQAWSMDYGVSPTEDAYSILKNAFDASYYGNRAPLPLFLHTPWLQNHAEAVTKFLDEVMDSATYPNVYMVTVRQMLAWMQNPVPVDQLTPEALGCGLAGGAPGSGGAAATRSSTGSPAGAPNNGPEYGDDNSGDDNSSDDSGSDGSGGGGNDTPLSGGGSDGGKPQVSTYSSDGGSAVAQALQKLGYQVRRMLR